VGGADRIPSRDCRMAPAADLPFLPSLLSGFLSET
jgi:hypothetical protein